MLMLHGQTYIYVTCSCKLHTSTTVRYYHSVIIVFLSSHFSEGVIRLAFQSLQLVVTDFLPIMPCSCLQLCVEAAAKFGSQHQELNISLTAIGLLVSVTTYMTMERTINT